MVWYSGVSVYIIHIIMYVKLEKESCTQQKQFVFLYFSINILSKLLQYTSYIHTSFVHFGYFNLNLIAVKLSHLNVYIEGWLYSKSLSSFLKHKLVKKRRRKSAKYIEFTSLVISTLAQLHIYFCDPGSSKSSLV